MPTILNPTIAHVNVSTSASRSATLCPACARSYALSITRAKSLRDAVPDGRTNQYKLPIDQPDPTPPDDRLKSSTVSTSSIDVQPTVPTEKVATKATVKKSVLKAGKTSTHAAPTAVKSHPAHTITTGAKTIKKGHAFK
jgi:hypothetical protein